jgi:hypothetical protein
MIIDYMYYALLNTAIVWAMFHYLVPELRQDKLLKVLGTSFVLMTLRMYVQFEGLGVRN